MAELAVNAALVVIGTAQIVSPLLKKLKLHKDAEKHRQNIDRWLCRMKAFMDDHYGREGSSRMVEDQVEKARDIAYDIEDVFEEIALHSPLYTFHNHTATREIHNFAHHVRHRFPAREIDKKIAAIISDIDDFKSVNEFIFMANPNQRASPGCSNAMISRLPVSPLLRDDEMVGYDEPKREFILQLVDREKRLVKIAVDGPSGAGKTTFVKNVFWNKEIQGQFDCHAWVRVSGALDVKELFVNLLKQLCGSRKEPYPPDDGSATTRKLQEYLARKRYIIVLDDVWRQEDWNNIKNALPDESCGSRIIVTTRFSNLASNCASSCQQRYSLNGLEWLQGWKLFCRKAFMDSNGECPSELKDSSVKIVKRCEGLPLAIVTVGGALAQKRRLPSEWEKFHDNLGSEISSGSYQSIITNTLQPSYMDLNTNLKCCFLYFSIFPEDYSVQCGRLLRLWVAERFAMKMGYKTAEEVAEEYLNELIHRNLVQVINWAFDGRPRHCRVSNIVHKFIIQKCSDENFATIFFGESTSQGKKIRRLSVHNDCKHFPRNSDIGRVRSMFLLRLLDEPLSDFEKHLRKLKLVRVLDLQGATITEFPKDIARLTLLRYLSFRDTKIKMIPTSIKNLSYLETLDLRQTDVTELPIAISFLHELRHLFIYKYNVDNFVLFDSVQGVKVYEGIGNLTNLQDLSLVKVGKKGAILKELKNLRKLKKLGLTGLRREHGKDLSAALELMENLTTLDLCSNTKEEYLELGEMRINPPRNVQRLYLKGQLMELPNWISSLQNVLRLSLKWSKLQHSPLKALERLPNLMELHLEDCYSGEELTFKASCFKKLKILLIEDFTKLHMVVIEEGAMPVLEQISLRRCPQLMIFPIGAHNLVKIEELTLYDMPEELIDRLRMNGDDRDLVRHIPVIHSFTLKRQSWSLENLSESFSP